MKKITFLIISVLLCVNASATEKVSQNLAIEYLKIGKIEDVINASINQDEFQLLAKATAEEKAKFHNLMISAMGWEAIKDQLADLIMNLYTKEEIDASIAFMKTPEGASAATKQKEFSKQFAAIISKNMQQAIRHCCAQKN
jgi:hypothetical protein